MKSENLLYHYTSIEAAISIMQSETLYLKNHQSMNDPTEFVHADNLLCPAAKQAYEDIFRDGKLITSLRGRKYNNALEADSKKSFEILNKLTGNDYYIFSATQHSDKYEMENGTLVMWRGYKNGCAIVFDKQRLIKIVDSLAADKRVLTAIADKVAYVKEVTEIKKIFSSEYESLVAWLKYIQSHAINPENTPLYEEVDGLNPYIKMKTLIKHHAYKSEEEFRIGIIRSIPKINSGAEGLIKIEKYKGAEIIKLFIGNGILPIKRIIVSPSYSQTKDLESFKKSNPRYMNIDIKKSEIPYSESDDTIPV